MTHLFEKYSDLIPTKAPPTKPTAKQMEERGADHSTTWDEDDKERAERTSERILNALRAAGGDWVERQTLIDITHRFSASIRTLRIRGHVIENRDRGAEWRYVKQTERIKVGSTWQSKYYSCAHWLSVAAKRKAFDGYACCNCKKKHDLTVHHWRYDLFAERLGDLMTLCRGCHDRIHACIKGVAFPTHIPKEIYDKLG